VSRKGRRKEALVNHKHEVNKCKLCCPTVWSTDHTEGQALKRRTGRSGFNVFQFLALHRPSNGPWTKRPLPERKDYVQGTAAPHKVHLAPMGRYNYPRRHSKKAKSKNPPGGLPSYKSIDTGRGFSKKPRSWVANRAHLETWDLSRKCEGCFFLK
jgi:hypothetical protein